MNGLTNGCMLGGAALAIGAAPLIGQNPRAVAERPAVRRALQTLRADNSWTLDQMVAICEIPAPPFGEARRAADFRRRLAALGLVNVRIDSVGNVIAERPGRSGGPGVVVSGHLDTVFPESTNVRVRRSGTRFDGPGIGDNCRGLAIVLAVARAMNNANLATDATVYFVGTVGEEGAGNLRGVRHLFARELAGRVSAFISIDDGAGTDVTTRAVGSNRYRVTFRGPGGHSYNDFGMPNPMHALGRAIAKIGELRVPDAPRTTFSVGIVSGGTTVNAITAAAQFDVDLRSELPAALAELDAGFRRAVAAALEEERARWPASRSGLTVSIDTIGIRPAGTQSDEAPIVRAVLEAGRALGFSPRTAASSTDANVPLSLGIPALAIGYGGTGGGAHSLAEWYDDGDDGYVGAQWALLLVAVLAGGQRE